MGLALPALPRRDASRLHLAHAALVHHLRRRHPRRPRLAGRPRPQPRHRLRGRRGVGAARRRRVGRGHPRRAWTARASPRRRCRPSSPTTATRIRVQTESLRRRRGAGDRHRPGRARRHRLDEVSLNSVGPSWGDEITSKAVRALVVLPDRHHDLRHVPLRVQDGPGHPRRPRPRRARHDRRVLGHRLRGHAGHGDRHPHDPGLLDLRRHRRVRQGRREHPTGVVHQPGHLQRHGEPVAQPDVDAVAEHLDHRAAADRARCWSSARSSWAPPRCRSSPSPCSSAWPRAPTRRSSSPARCSRSSRSASPGSRTCGAGSKLATRRPLPPWLQRLPSSRLAAATTRRRRRGRGRSRGRARRQRAGITVATAPRRPRPGAVIPPRPRKKTKRR